MLHSQTTFLPETSISCSTTGVFRRSVSSFRCWQSCLAVFKLYLVVWFMSVARFFNNIFRSSVAFFFRPNVRAFRVDLTTGIKRYSLALTILAISSSAASASEVCMPVQELEAALIDWHGEAPVEQRPENTLLWASADTGTWTLVAYQAGTACRIDHGTGWTGDLPLQVSEKQ